MTVRTIAIFGVIGALGLAGCTSPMVFNGRDHAVVRPRQAHMHANGK